MYPTHVALATKGEKKEFPHITCHWCNNNKGHCASVYKEERRQTSEWLLIMAGVDNNGEFESFGASVGFHVPYGWVYCPATTS
jgi:hypothetical protein